ncbi:MAG TPA: PEGA domain-containing protein [Kofleriaceae bacterium]
MLARRVIALSPDKAFGKQLASALKAAGGTVDLHLSLEELGKSEIHAALLVLHLDGELVNAATELLPRLVGDTRVIAVLARGQLASVVDVMLRSDRVVAMMTTESFDSRELAALATRTLAGDIFGLEKLVRWGTLVHSQLVSDYQEKSLAIAQISEFAEHMGVRRKYREAIDQCLDEMLMNALYNAPVDDKGQPVFSDIPTKTRVSLRVEQKVVVQYACDGTHFCISVRDAFGTLQRETVLRYLDKCLHSEQQIDRKVGGAGLGLYMMVNSASTVLFNVLPGVATEVACVFDLESPKLVLDQLGYFHEKIDAAGRLAGGPSKKLPAGASHVVERRQSDTPPPAAAPPPALIRLLVVAIFAMCILIGFVAWPRLFNAKHYTHVIVATTPPGATIEVDGRAVGRAVGSGLDVRDLEVGRAYPVVARLDGYEPAEGVMESRSGSGSFELRLRALAATIDLDSQPSGASVELDGKPAGNTPLHVTTLSPGSTASVVFKKQGYKDATVQLAVPEAGKSLVMVQPLLVAADLARIELDTEPPGARVVQNGQVLAGVLTPAQVIVEADHPVKFVLSMPHRVPAVIELTPGHGAEIVKHAKLADGATVTIDANLDGLQVSLTGAASCQKVDLPATCVVLKGTYPLEITGPTNAHAARQLGVTTDVTLHFSLGTVEAGGDKQIVVGPNHTAKRVVLEAGRRNVTLTDDAGTHATAVIVKAGQTVVAN